MKDNLLAVLGAGVMILLAVGALYFAMTVYAEDKFVETWILTPTVIERELKPLYSEALDSDSTEY